jgi:hypothetical protein
MALSIASEGTEVAKWLTAKGVTAFVLKYRLAHTGEDGTKEAMDAMQDPKKFHCWRTESRESPTEKTLNELTVVFINMAFKGSARFFGILWQSNNCDRSGR